MWQLPVLSSVLSNQVGGHLGEQVQEEGRNKSSGSWRI